MSWARGWGRQNFARRPCPEPGGGYGAPASSKDRTNSKEHTITAHGMKIARECNIRAIVQTTCHLHACSMPCQYPHSMCLHSSAKCVTRDARPILLYVSQSVTHCYKLSRNNACFFYA